jgi:hypothetical protein
MTFLWSTFDWTDCYFSDEVSPRPSLPTNKNLYARVYVFDFWKEDIGEILKNSVEVGHNRVICSRFEILSQSWPRQLYITVYLQTRGLSHRCRGKLLSWKHIWPSPLYTTRRMDVQSEAW